MSEAQYSTVASAGEINLGASERGQLLELLRRYQRELLSWTSAPRPREVREILKTLQGDAGKLRAKLQSLLQISEPAKEATLDRLLLNAPAPKPTTQRLHGWHYPRNDWHSWLEDTLLRVILLESWSQRTTEHLPKDSKGGRDRNEFLRGLIRNLHEFFLQNHGQNERRFGQERRSHFLYFVEAALRCIPGHPETKALAKTISRALGESPRTGQNRRRKS